MKSKKLPESLFAAFEWTAAAAELAELRDATGPALDAYVAASVANARQHDTSDVDGGDLRDLAEWLRENPEVA